MRLIKSLLIGLFAVLTKRSDALITSDPLCNCDTCCHIDDSTMVDFTGKTIVQITYPDVSYTGNYTVLNYQAHDLTNTTYDYQYVFKYNNGFKSTFDRNVLIFTDTSVSTLNCTDAHVYYGDPESNYYTKIDMVAIEQDGTSYCTLDINGKLSREEISDDTNIYFAFNRLVDEKHTFNIMYDLSEQGVILPEEDIIPYPYIIQGGSVTAIDTNEATEFYIDVGLNVSNVDVTQAGIDPSCLSIDELFANGNAYWYVPDGPNCNITLISGGEGDAVTSGRTYHIKLSQFEYETCSITTRESGNQLHFDFRLVLPSEHFETNEEGDDAALCNYFQSPLNVQNITVSMDQNVESTLTSEYITQFDPIVSALTPVQCTDYETYPTPHVKLKVEITASFPGVNTVDFNTVGQVTFGESWESNNLLWDDNGDGTIPTYTCTEYPDPKGDGTGVGFDADAYTECTFKYISSVCEPIYVTDDDQSALERNTTRFIEGFAVVQTIPGGMTATYTSGSINAGVDNTKWDKSYAIIAGERDVIDVSDVFNVQLDLRNYYLDYSVDWDNTTLLTMKDDMIARLRVGQVANSPFDFTSDLSLIIKTVTVTLKNPITEETITSYIFSANDKVGFMGFSWTPYYRDPRFCKWYDSAGGNDKCKDFFVDGTRSNGHHNTAWITDVMPKECQTTGTLAGEEDTNNSDFFIFTPREWFRDNTQAYVEMTVRVTAIVHKCTENARLLEALPGVRGRQLQNVQSDVLYVSDEIIVTFVTDENGDEHVEVRKPPSESWIDANMTWVIVLSVVGGIIVLGLLFLWIQKRNSHYGHFAVPVISTSSRPDF